MPYIFAYIPSQRLRMTVLGRWPTAIKRLREVKVRPNDVDGHRRDQAATAAHEMCLLYESVKLMS